MIVLQNRRSRSPRVLDAVSRLALVAVTPFLGALLPAPLSGQDPAALIRIDTTAAAPREVVSLLLTIEPGEPVAGFDLSIDFDETRLIGLGFAPRFRAEEGWFLAVERTDNRDDEPDESGVTEGSMVVRALFTDELAPVTLPIGVETEVLELSFQVRSDASDGTAQVSLVDGAGWRDPKTGLSVPLSNRVHVPEIGALPTESVAGGIEVRGPPLPPAPRPPPPERFSRESFSDLISTIEGTDSLRIAAVAPAGDIDGDGFEELLVRYQPRDLALGREDLVIVLRGGRSVRGTLDPFGRDRLASLRTSSVPVPPPPLRATSSPVYSAGGVDVDGDLQPDFLVGTGLEPDFGGAAVLLVLAGGPDDPLPPEIEPAMIGEEVRGSVIVDDSGLLSPPFSQQISLIPDMNGDGRGEVCLCEGDLFRKRCFILFGSPDLPPLIELQQIGLEVPGVVIAHAIEQTEPASIRSVVPLGDVDGDDLGDLGIVTLSAIRGQNRRNRVFVVLGRTEFAELLEFDRYNDEDETDLPEGAMRFSGYEDVARAGDLDGDGFGDFVLFGLPLGDSGWCHIVFGRPRSDFPTSLEFEEFRSSDLGFRMREARFRPGDDTLAGATPKLYFGSGRDVDGDGFDDLVFGAPRRHVRLTTPAAIASGGAAFLLRGSSERNLGSSFSLNEIATRGLGIQIDGFEAQAHFGLAVHAASLDRELGQDLVVLSREVDCDGDTTPFDADYRAVIIPGNALVAPPEAPHVSTVLPRGGSSLGGEPLIVVGRGFDETAIVEIGNREAGLVTALGEGIMVVEAPPAASPIGAAVTVRTAAGESEGGTTYLYLAPTDRSLSVGSGDPQTRSFFAAPEFETRSLGIAHGDFNGDGHVDLAAGVWTPGNNPDESDSNFALHLIFGPGARGVDTPLASLESPAAVVLTPDEDWHYYRGLDFGSVRSGGDVNGDGYDDFIIGAEGETREWRIVFGRKEFESGPNLAGDEGSVRIFSEASRSWLDNGFSIIADVDGDDRDEIVVSARLDGGTSLFLVAGREAYPPEIRIESVVELELGSRIRSRAGKASLPPSDFVLPAGDFDGDGSLEILTGGRGEAVAGAAMTISLGEFIDQPQEVRVDSTFLHGRFGLLISGSSLLSGSDFWASSAGDIDGDGDVDLAFYQDDITACTRFPRSGRVFVFDHEAVLENAFDAERFPFMESRYRDLGGPDFAPYPRASGVVEVESPHMLERVGAVMCPAGDFDGDGFHDLFIAGRGEHGYIVLGREDFYDPATAHVDLRDPKGRAVPVFVRAFLAEGGFDWDADGFGDVLVASADGSVHVLFGSGRPTVEFIRGDADRSGSLNITDSIFTLNFLFAGTARPVCFDALDSDDDGRILITDAIFALLHLFGTGPAPPAPYPDPGVDETADELDCRE